jgi:7-cyano-7-deazaguanine synthase in queuosine biosynthesis
MPERLVVCGGLQIPRNARTNTLSLNVNAPAGSPSKVNLHLGDLSGPLADNIPDVLTDMLEIAAYVYCADQFTSRGSELMTDMGADWRRKFRFKIPVRCPDVWTRNDVREALVETLGFLTEDEYGFEFVQASKSKGLQPYLGFSDPSAQTISPEEVILFSGGLDSLAGVVDELIGNQKQVVLVSHQSSTMIASKQNNLVAALRERTKSGQLFYVPVTINKGQEEASEFTQRSRSLLFATLGVIVARMFGKRNLRFFENGIVSFNLPIAEHVLGARASRTTHPRVLADCSRLFSQLLSESITIENPYVWKTKADVVQVLADRGCAGLISETISCTRVREATKQSRHCGTCSQCVDRRFSVLAGGLGEYDSADNYVIDLFEGEHKPGSDLTLVECYVVRAQKLATVSEQAFFASYGQLFRALPYLPGTPDDNARKIHDLHRRYGRQVVEVVDRELRNNASLVQALSLPEKSLLAMILSPVAKQPDYMDPIEAEESASVQAASDTRAIVRKPIVFAIDQAARKVLFGGGPELKGSGFQLVRALAKEFEEDIEGSVAKDSFRFIGARELSKRLGIDEQSLRQRVSRTRKLLEQQFLKGCDIQLDDHDVIQNEEWKGYRLNPYLLRVKPAQLQDTEAVSQVAPALVTTPLSSR